MLQGIFTEYDLSKQDMKQVSFFHSLYFDKIGFFDNAYSHKVVRENPDHFILFLCTKGKGYLEHHGIRYNISAGNIFLHFPEWRMHTVRMNQTLGRYIGRIFILIHLSLCQF